jgi:nickel-dependent lactate racemase
VIKKDRGIEMQINYGGTDTIVDSNKKKDLLAEALKNIKSYSKILVLPPDITRLHSGAGELTKMLYDILGKDKMRIMPAIGTHEALTEEHIRIMYPGVPRELFMVHDWRNDVVQLGVVPSDFIKEASEGKLDYEIPIQVNKILLEGGYDLIISVGQVVPHENTGFSNYSKNIFVGIGGEETINKSHFLAGVYGMERIMGRIDTPVRKVFDYAEQFIKGIPIIYIMTVMGREDNKLVTRGLFIGDDRETFEEAAKLSQKVNLTKLKEPLKKTVVYLDPVEYQSHWLGNKSIYRTRMAMADGGELIVIAPGLRMYGEDPEIDRLIRKYGYHGTDEILQEVKENQELRNNLVSAAHLIHGSSEGRFRIIYAPGHLSKEETENAGYEWADVNSLMKQYDINKLKDGYNGDFYYISNPALGLWTVE